MKKSEMDRLLRDELGHIPRTPRTRSFRMISNICRRRDLGENPAAPKRQSFLKAIEGFDPGDLDYDIAFFGPLPVDATKQADAARVSGGGAGELHSA